MKVYNANDRLFHELSFFVDCSRGAVPKIEKLIELADILSALDYTSLQLYLEDTYKVEEEPYFGYMRGAYSKEEIWRLREHCQKVGLKLVPCIQTLAHLEKITKYDSFARLFEISNILMVGDDAVYAFIEKLLASLQETFGGDTINLGMDEAFLLGRGKQLEKRGKLDKVALMNEHVSRVCDLAKKYGFTNCSVWADMFLGNGKEQAKLPENCQPIYWTYSKETFDQLEGNIDYLQGISQKCGFAGSALKYSGFIPFNQYGIETIERQIQVTASKNVDEFVLTTWGDGCSETSVFSVLPTVFACAAYAHGKKLDEQFQKAFADVCEMPFEDFLLIDIPNKPERKQYDPMRKGNQSFMLFYNDLLLGILDSIVIDGIDKAFQDATSRLKKVAKGKYAYLFESAAALTDFLSLKATLGKELYEAYQAQDFVRLKSCEKKIKAAIKKLNVFIEIYQKQWYLENKSFGFERILYRFGGLKQRLAFVGKTVRDYVGGKLGKIEELEEKHLPNGWFNGGWAIEADTNCWNTFHRFITCGDE